MIKFNNFISNFRYKILAMQLEYNNFTNLNKIIPHSNGLTVKILNLVPSGSKKKINCNINIDVNYLMIVIYLA